MIHRVQQIAEKITPACYLNSKMTNTYCQCHNSPGGKRALYCSLGDSDEFNDANVPHNIGKSNRFHANFCDEPIDGFIRNKFDPDMISNTEGEGDFVEKRPLNEFACCGYVSTDDTDGRITTQSKQNISNENRSYGTTYEDRQLLPSRNKWNGEYLDFDEKADKIEEIKNWHRDIGQGKDARDDNSNLCFHKIYRVTTSASLKNESRRRLEVKINGDFLSDTGQLVDVPGELNLGNTNQDYDLNSIHEGMNRGKETVNIDGGESRKDQGNAPQSLQTNTRSENQTEQNYLENNRQTYSAGNLYTITEESLSFNGSQYARPPGSKAREILSNNIEHPEFCEEENTSVLMAGHIPSLKGESRHLGGENGETEEKCIFDPRELLSFLQKQSKRTFETNNNANVQNTRETYQITGFKSHTETTRESSITTEGSDDFPCQISSISNFTEQKNSNSSRSHGRETGNLLKVPVDPKNNLLHKGSYIFVGGTKEQPCLNLCSTEIRGETPTIELKKKLAVEWTDCKHGIPVFTSNNEERASQTTATSDLTIPRKMDKDVSWGCRTPFVFTHGETPRKIMSTLSDEEGERAHGDDVCIDKVPPLTIRRRKTPTLDQLLAKNGKRDKTPQHRGSLPASVNDLSTAIQNGRSPAKRKRDNFLKRRHNSTSAIQFSSISSVSSNLSSMSECDEEGGVPPGSIDSSVGPESGYSTRIPSVEEGYSKSTGVKTNGRSVHSNSCPSIQSSYQIFDIIGDTSDIRFPWQRDASTQCNIVNDISKCRQTKSKSVDIPRSNMASLTPPQTINMNNVEDSESRPISFVRPHSIGCIEGTLYEEEIERLRQVEARYNRKSDSFLQCSPRALRKRGSFVFSDEQGSVSDLGSISENPDTESDGNIAENGQISNLSHELQKIALRAMEDSLEPYVLPSPRISPTLLNGHYAGHQSGSDSDEYSDSHPGRYLTVPRKNSRRRSSLSLTSISDESDVEPSPPVARRGRRAAIVDTKNFGDVSPTNLSPEHSPSNSCDEGENASNIAERLRRRRSSIDLTMNVYPGDLLVHEHHKKLIKRNTIADFYSQKNGSTTNVSEENKKGRQSFSLLKLMKTRSKESLPRLEDVLSQLKPSEFKDNHLQAYKNLHWSDLIASSDKQTDAMTVPELERKRREAVWELFKSECVFLIDHLMVLKHCFMEPLKKVQVEGHVMFAEPQDIFGNLDELCYVSYTFCKDFIAALLKDMSSTDFGSTTVLVRAFERFTTHSRDGGVYHTYCLNYVNALTYLEQLRRHDDFCEFEKWCTQDQRCNRLQLTDLLVAPMQHCTKFPLLLSNIQKYTDDPVEIQLLADLIEKVEASLQKMEDKMKWAKNYERLQEIQGQLQWPSVSDIDPRAFVPEFLKSALSKQPCERLICSPKRQLLHEGYLTLVETTKSCDVYVFLFDDILLITKTKKPQRKKHSIDSSHMRMQQTNQSEKTTYSVVKQPIALDRLSLHDVNQTESAANGLKYAFVLVQISRYQQIIGVYTLQSGSESIKSVWLDKISGARKKFTTGDVSRQSSLKEDSHQPPSENLLASEIIRASAVGQNRRQTSLRNPHGKSLSMDAVYI